MKTTVEEKTQKLVEKHNIQVETPTEESIKKDFEKDIENMPVEYRVNKIYKLQKHFLEELNGLTTYDAKVILEKVQSVIDRTSIVTFK